MLTIISILRFHHYIGTHLKLRTVTGKSGKTKISYYVNKLFLFRRNMLLPKGRCCECSAKIFENTHIYISSHIFLARLRPLRGVAHIYFSNLSFYCSTKKLVEHFRCQPFSAPPRRPREAFHCVRYDGKKRPGIGQ